MTYKKIYMTFNIKRHMHARVIFRCCQCWLWPIEWAGLPRRQRPDNSTSQITSPLNGPVIFLKSLSAAFCELASSVGRELRAHSGLSRMETLKSLRMRSDKARVFETVSARIFFLALEFVTRGGGVCLEIGSV